MTEKRSYQIIDTVPVTDKKGEIFVPRGEDEQPLGPNQVRVSCTYEPDGKRTSVTQKGLIIDKEG